MLMHRALRCRGNSSRALQQVGAEPSPCWEAGAPNWGGSSKAQLHSWEPSEVSAGHFPQLLSARPLIFGITTGVGTSSSRCKVHVFDLAISSINTLKGVGATTALHGHLLRELHPCVTAAPSWQGTGGDGCEPWGKRRTPWRVESLQGNSRSTDVNFVSMC